MKKRFELKSYHFHTLKAVIYDHLEHKELHLSIYELINLLNDVAQEQFDLIGLSEEIKNKLEQIEEKINS